MGDKLNTLSLKHIYNTEDIGVLSDVFSSNNSSDLDLTVDIDDTLNTMHFSGPSSAADLNGSHLDTDAGE